MSLLDIQRLQMILFTLRIKKDLSIATALHTNFEYFFHRS